MELIHQIIYRELIINIKNLGDYNFVGSSDEFVLKDTHKAAKFIFKNSYSKVYFFFAEYDAFNELCSRFEVLLFNDRYILVDLDKFSEIKYGKE